MTEAGTGDRLDRDHKILIARCLEAAVDCGKVMPFEALAVADRLEIQLPSWIAARDRYYSEHAKEEVRSPGPGEQQETAGRG